MSYPPGLYVDINGTAWQRYPATDTDEAFWVSTRHNGDWTDEEAEAAGPFRKLIPEGDWLRNEEAP